MEDLLVADLEYDVAEKYAQFLIEVLDAYTKIEGSELGDAQHAMLLACGAANSYMQEDGWRFAVLLDKSIRSMLSSDWFRGELEEDFEWLGQCLEDARQSVEPIRQEHIRQSRRYHGKYGGAEAEKLIAAWEAP